MQKLGAIRWAVVAAVTIAAALSPRAFGQLDVPALSSLPVPLTALTKTLFLDFDGDFTSSFGPYSNITTPAYDIDSDPASFSALELMNIEKIWAGVAEKFSPFNLNVTTVDPGNRTSGVTMAVNIGGDGAWQGGPAGGIGSVNGFISDFTTAFVFPGWLGNGTPKYVTEAAAHEAGHAFGLRHQSAYDPVTGGKIQEYNNNNGSLERSPIMGVSYYATRGQWWHGPSSISRAFIQDDLSILSRTGSFTNNFGYRPDDFPTVSPLSTASDFAVAAQGIIENVTDIESFAFHTPGGVATLFADVAPNTPMLDLSLSILDGDGNILASAATTALAEYLQLPLDEGDYRIVISSAGNYGDVGQWFLSGFVAPEPAGLSLLCAAVLLLRRRSRPRLPQVS